MHTTAEPSVMEGKTLNPTARLGGRYTPHDLGLIFVAAAFPLNLWALLITLYALPSWLIRLTAWEMVGTISYTLFFALIESLLTAGALIVAGLLVPRRWFSRKVIALLAVWIWLAAVWAILININYDALRSLGMARALFWLALAGLTFGASLLAIWRFEKVSAWIIALLERLTVLVAVYVFLGVLSGLVVIVRNLL
jgi:hypothetical protein